MLNYIFFFLLAIDNDPGIINNNIGDRGGSNSFLETLKDSLSGYFIGVIQTG
jgi:hypothetical protein